MSEAFALTMPLWEIFVRASVVYLAMIVLLRAIPSRNAGHISPNDILTLVIVGTLGTTAIIGESHSIADIVLMIGLVLLWSLALDFLEYRVPWLRGAFRHRQTILIEGGRLVRRNMRRELVTEEELMAVLREKGIDEVSAVRCAFMEADGEISVIAADR